MDTLQAGSGSNTFNILTDTAIDLLGSTGNDTFAFFNTAELNGSIDGGSGTNALDYTNYDNPVVATLTGSTANGYSGTEVFSITGTYAGIRTLTGTPPTSTSCRAKMSPQLGPLTQLPRLTTILPAMGRSPSRFNFLQGGAGDDTFQFQGQGS